MAIFGNNTTGDTADDCGVDAKQASNYTAPADGTITKLSYYCWINAGTPVFKGVIYSNIAGEPSALLATGTEGTPGAGAAWVDSTINLAITSGTVYWLGIIVGNDAGDKINDKLRDAGNVGGIRYDGSDAYLGGASDPWGASDYSSEQADLCIYATYEPPGGGPTVKKGGNLGGMMAMMLNSKMLYSACNPYTLRF